MRKWKSEEGLPDECPRCYLITDHNNAVVRVQINSAKLHHGLLPVKVGFPP
jgi:hypothetical protein